MKKSLMVLATLLSLPLFAQSDDVPPPPNQGFSQMFMLFAIAMAFFYFILWRPEQKRRKVSDDMRNKLKKGDKVNALGIIGTVSRINEQTVVLRMIDGSKIEVVKAAITEVTPITDEESKKISANE